MTNTYLFRGYFLIMSTILIANFSVKSDFTLEKKYEKLIINRDDT